MLSSIILKTSCLWWIRYVLFVDFLLSLAKGKPRALVKPKFLNISACKTQMKKMIYIYILFLIYLKNNWDVWGVKELDWVWTVLSTITGWFNWKINSESLKDNSFELKKHSKIEKLYLQHTKPLPMHKHKQTIFSLHYIRNK